MKTVIVIRLLFTLLLLLLLGLGAVYVWQRTDGGTNLPEPRDVIPRDAICLNAVDGCPTTTSTPSTTHRTQACRFEPGKGYVIGVDKRPCSPN